ncbi:hypothetical protein JAAARDRAFT_200851 [Jaapia argillacea MUCL 33604]|uniref:Uncharacterized protein n=1 Tax=Jaapia argillacea MUCL 33604 TaxID=933084 RepID=A0A067P6N0_9AGAM|nr:hypothetical protein JAAARDRAFT_200851 [Jaapia argillacea MUCL 33604]
MLVVSNPEHDQYFAALRCVSTSATVKELQEDEASLVILTLDAIKALTIGPQHKEDLATEGDNSVEGYSEDVVPHKRSHIDPQILEESLKGASKHVTVKGTADDYTRYWKQFMEFCERVGYVAKAKDINMFVREDNISKDFPTWVAVWIMSK